MRRTTCWAPLPPAVWLRRPRPELPFPGEAPGTRLYAFARQGLHLGVRALGLRPGDAVLVPAYHHGSEVQAFVGAGLRCVFYGRGDGVRPDTAELEALLDDDVRALHLVHTLGFPQDSARWRRWCDDHGLLLVEDAAQAWLATTDGEPVGAAADLAVFCAYKTVGVPEGAFVVCREPLPEPGSNDAPGLGELVRKHGAWLAQRSSAVGAAVERLNMSRPFDAAAELDLRLTKTGAWTTTAPLLRRLSDPAAASRRRANYRVLLDHVDGQVPEPFSSVPDGASPFAFPLLVEDKAATLRRLEDRGVRALDVWSVPHPLLDPDRFAAVAALRRGVVGLPVHQELRSSDLAAVARAAAPRRPGRRLGVEVHEDLDAVLPAWRRLAEGCPNPFLTPEWAEAWQRHARPLRGLFVVARDADGTERLLWPFERTHRAGIRTLSPWGGAAADLTGPVCAPGNEVAAAHALRRALATDREWDVLLAERLPAAAGWDALLGSGVLRREPSPVLRLPSGDWEALLAGRSRSFRSQVRRRERALVDRHGAAFRLSTPATLPEDLDTLFRLHTLRWGGPTEFTRLRAFHEDFARTAAARGWLRLWLLEVDGSPVAAWYGLRHAGEEWYYQSGRDPRWDTSHVGSVLLAHTVRAAAEDGARAYRLLRGGEAYKLRWADHDPGTVVLALHRGAVGTAAGAGLRAAAALPDVARSRLRRALEGS